MDSLPTFFDSYGALLWVLLCIAILIIACWTVALHRRTNRVQARIDALLGDVSDGSTAQVLAEYLSTVRRTAAAVQDMRAEHDRLVRLMPSVIRHIGLVRFSPFHDTGGDQSFTLALLDSEGDGVVITGLHSRHDSRLYAKPIEAHGSSYSLTPEEREAMERALSRKATQVS